MSNPETSQNIPFKARAIMAARLFQESITHPLITSRITYEPATKKVQVVRYKETGDLSKNLSLTLRAKIAGALLKETVLHPFVNSYFTVHPEINEVLVEREHRPKSNRTI